MDIAEARSSIDFLQSQIDRCSKMIASIRASVENEAEEITLKKPTKIRGLKLDKWDSYSVDIDGNLHNNKDLPAIDYLDKDRNRIQVWYKHGRLHRRNRPAIIQETTDQGTIKQWWFDGIRFKSRALLRKHIQDTKEVPVNEK